MGGNELVHSCELLWQDLGRVQDTVSVQGQVGRGPEQPDLVSGSPAQGMGL